MDEQHRLWAKNMRFWREKLGYTQDSFADALGVKQASVSRWENCKALPTDTHKIAIATELHLDVATLFPLVRSAA